MKNNILYIILLQLVSQLSTAQTSISKTIVSGGISREFRIYVPSIYDGTKAVPVVFNFHGYTSNNIAQEIYGDFRPIADTANFILIHPQGTVIGGSTAWNNFSTIGSTPDDIGFVADMIDTLAAMYYINKNKVYATGLSNGGFMSYDLACLLSNKIAAIASVSGSMIASHSSACNASHPTPVMQIHGDIDGVVSYNGLGGIVSSVHIDSLVKKWVVYNNCNATPSLTNLPNINTSDNSTVEHYVYSGGLKNTTVEFYKIIGGGHTWPGSSILVTSNGNTNLDFNASKEIWRFFSQYSLDNLVTNTKDFTTGNKVIKIFPNPSNGTFSVHSTTNNIEKVSVFSTDGKLLKSISLLNKQLAVEVSDFAKGVYFIKVECSNKQLYTSKLIVE